MKKKNLQKVLAVSLAGALAVGTMAGCGSNTDATTEATTKATEKATEKDTTKADETEKDTTEAGSSEESTTEGGSVDVPVGPGPVVTEWEAFDEQVTLRVPVYDRGVEGVPNVSDNYWTKWIQENFGDEYNIKVEFVPITRTDVMTDYSLLAASEDLPTILMEYDYPKVSKWAADGYLTTFDMDAFAEVAPNYYAKMVENGQLIYSEMGGETYFALAERPYWDTNYAFVNFVRMDWLREVGYDYVPTVYAEWCDAMEKIKEAGLAEYPAGGTMVTGVGSDQNYTFRDFPQDESEWAMYSSVTGTPSLGWYADYELLKRENQKYNDGFLNPEYYIIDAETDKANFVNGETYQYGAYMSASVDWLNAFYEQNPDAELAVVPVTMKEDKDGGTTPAYRSNNPFGMIVCFSSFATEEEITAAWMYMEWMLQEENLFTMQWGIEGENFNYDKETGLPVSVGDYSGDYTQGYNNSKDYWCVAVEARNAGTITDMINAIAPQGLPQNFAEDMEKQYYDQKQLSEEGYATIDPLFSVTIDAEAEYSGTLLSLYKEYRDALTMCAPEEFDAKYEELSQKYADAGFTEVVEERLKAYEDGNSTVLPDAARK